MIRLRRRIAERDEGSALILVMLIATLVMIMLGTASTTLIDQIKPTGSSIAAGQALAAAEAGIEDFTARINANCSDTSSFQCDWANGQSSNSSVTDPRTQAGTPVSAADGSQTNEAYVWKVSYTTSGFARVVSVGQALDANGKPTQTKSLVADLGATPSFNDFEYFTKYETFPSDFVDDFYRRRNIQITSSTNASGSSLSGSGTLHWNGTCTSTDPNNLDTCVPGGASSSEWSTNICDDLYYPTDDGNGRGTDAAWSNAGRRATPAVQGAMGTDNTFAYYTEGGTFSPTTGSPVAATHTDVCDSSFEPNMVMNGPIYSQDAYLIDRGDDTGNSKNSMPIFDGYAYSMWNGVINNLQQPKGANQGYDRAYPNTNGQISTGLSPQPVYTTNKLELPANADKAKPYATCTYTGPIRIQIKQGLAYITSPGTPTSPAPAGPSYCYTSTGSFASSGGVVDAQVPISNTLIYVKNPTSGSPTAATPSNPIFNLSSTTPVPATTISDGLAGAGTWTDDATYSTSQSCPTPADPTRRRNFDCETGTTTPRGDMLTKIRAAVDAALRGSDGNATHLQTALDSAIKGLMNSAALDPSQPVYYIVTVGAPTGSSVQTQCGPALAPADAFYQQGCTGGFSTTTLNTTVTIQRCSPKCNGNNGKTIVQGAVSATSSSGSSAVTTERWPWFGAQTGPNTYTDPNNDITQYYNGYGDAYVEGTLHGSMTIVAEHDIVASNDITYSDTRLGQTSDGLALVADHDVRVYRPMTCTDDGTAGATTPGYCPDDLTGVYNSALSWPLPTNYPALKYKPDNAPSMTSDGQGLIYASVFTLRGCFMIDNFYRGGIGNSATIYGGLYQYHRGPTSLPYQGRPYQGSTTKMPGVVLTYNYDNMRAGQTENGGLRVPWIPNPQGRPVGSPRTWNVTSISTGT